MLVPRHFLWTRWNFVKREEYVSFPFLLYLFQLYFYSSSEGKLTERLLTPGASCLGRNQFMAALLQDFTPLQPLPAKMMLAATILLRESQLITAPEQRGALQKRASLQINGTDLLSKIFISKYQHPLPFSVVWSLTLYLKSIFENQMKFYPVMWRFLLFLLIISVPRHSVVC